MAQNTNLQTALLPRGEARKSRRSSIAGTQQVNFDLAISETHMHVRSKPLTTHHSIASLAGVNVNRH
jgi:hypothetical protein